MSYADGIELKNELRRNYTLQRMQAIQQMQALLDRLLRYQKKIARRQLQTHALLPAAKLIYLRFGCLWF